MLFCVLEVAVLVLFSLLGLWLEILYNNNTNITKLTNKTTVWSSLHSSWPIYSKCVLTQIPPTSKMVCTCLGCLFYFPMPHNRVLTIRCVRTGKPIVAVIEASAWCVFMFIRVFVLLYTLGIEMYIYNRLVYMTHSFTSFIHMNSLTMVISLLTMLWHTQESTIQKLLWRRVTE